MRPPNSELWRCLLCACMCVHIDRIYSTYTCYLFFLSISVRLIRVLPVCLAARLSPQLCVSSINDDLGVTLPPKPHLHCMVSFHLPRVTKATHT